jgi:hypothetical protein
MDCISPCKFYTPPHEEGRDPGGGWSYVFYRRAGTLALVDDETTLQRFYWPGLMGLLLKGQKLTRRRSRHHRLAEEAMA